MNEERDAEQAGAPVDETGASEIDVQAAVERAIDPVEIEPAVLSEPDDGSVPVDVIFVAAETPAIISVVDMPSASAVAPPTVLVTPNAELNAEKIQIAPDHPMAGFYVQTPLPPEVRGNRGFGVLIAVVASLGFAVVYAGVIAAWLAPAFPPSTFLSDGLLPYLTSWGFIFSVIAFFVGLSLIVLIVGRAGWWAYVLGGFLVAALVWVAAAVGFALSRESFDIVITGMQPLEVLQFVGLTLPTLFAAIVAREAAVWFGAWIGARGRKIAAKNADARSAYEARLAEQQA
jgi:hypothetical protein